MSEEKIEVAAEATAAVVKEVKKEEAQTSKKEDKKAAAQTAKKEEVKVAATTTTSATDCQCQEKLDKLIAALIISHPAIAKQIKIAGLAGE